VINGWKSQGCFTKFQKYLGYRIELVNVTLTATPAGMNYAIKIKNSGYATIYNPKVVNLYFMTPNNSVVSQLTTSDDPRTWFVGTTNTLQGTINYPATSGNYFFKMEIASPEPNISNISHYRIVFANDNVPDSNRMNVLGAIGINVPVTTSTTSSSSTLASTFLQTTTNNESSTKGPLLKTSTRSCQTCTTSSVPDKLTSVPEKLTPELDSTKIAAIAGSSVVVLAGAGALLFRWKRGRFWKK
jgi:hypothetical protein